ncbi:hypothetical protein Tco_1130529, partial [Tanacetum coccineum]
SGGNGSRMLGFVGGNGKLLCFIAAVGLQWAQLYVGKVTNGYKSNGGQMNKFATNVGVTSDSISGPTSSQMLQVFCNDRPFVNLWYASSDDKACTFVGTAAYVPPEKLNSSHVTTGDPVNANWHMDTGASSHLNSSAHNLNTIFNSRMYPSVLVGDGKSIPVTNTGHSTLPTPY